MVDTQLAIKAYRRRFRHPVQTAHGPWSWREGLLLRLTTRSGATGYGEIAPIPWFGSETLAQAEAFCQAQAGAIAPTLSIPDSLPATQFGVATALAQLDCPSLVQPVPTHAIAGLLPAGEAALAAWLPLWHRGTRTFKWKIGVAPIERELQWLGRLVRALPTAAHLRLDANGGLTRAEAEQWLTCCDRLAATSQGCTLEYLEQPLPPSDFDAMTQLSHRYKTAIALDESVATCDQLAHHWHRGWRGLYVVKPSLAGHPNRLRQLWQRHSPQLVFSSAFETVVGHQAALALATEYHQTDSGLALGFGTLGWFEDDWDTLTPARLWDSL